jgi:elongation factor Ts
MATITTEQIKELREKTGVSVMQCKKALEEAGGDMNKALVILKKKSSDITVKKADRVFGAGVIGSYVHNTGTVGAMVELVCETDFVAKNDDFKTLARDIAMHVVASNPEFLTSADISESAKKTASEVFEKEIQSGTKGKPENIKQQILAGKLDAYFKERVLMDQAFIKNADQTITDLVNQAIQKFGEKIAVVRFVRFQVLS